jgi:hypothetical protein
MSDTYVTSVLVDGRINSFGTSTNPYFNWNFVSPDGLLTGYEIRIALPDPMTGQAPADLGTDSLVGDVWHPGRRRTPEAYGVRFNDDGTAFGGPRGCLQPKSLQPGVIYYFQVQVFDDQSDWFIGYFSIEIPPTAENVLIFPAAPVSNDELFATYDFVANPGQTESSKTQITWYRQQWPNGTYLAAVPAYANQKTIPAGVAQHGDLWQFSVRPNDGQEYSISTYSSQVVTIGNHLPKATALSISPSLPKTSDNLEATFSLGDRDGDDVTATIRWYRNNGLGFLEQVAFLNSTVVPASSVSLNDSWYFTVLPNDGYVNGLLETSPTVTVTSTPPYPLSMSVDGALMPSSLSDPNPVISWTYQDNDGQPQQQYQMVLGTRPISVNATGGTSASAHARQFYGGNGILSSTGSNGTVAAGNDVYDSGVITSNDNFFRYSTSDFLQAVTMTANSFDVFNDYAVLPDQVTLSLTIGSSSGQVAGQFNGQTSFYDVTLTYVKEENSNATYKLVVDNAVVGQFNSFYGSGLGTYTFGSVWIESGSTVGIMGLALSSGAAAQFQGLSLKPTGQITIMAADFDILSGYLNDGSGGIKLAGLAGTASTTFAYPSGKYNIELVYITETNGRPSLTLSINSTMLMNFAYEIGAETRSRFIAGVQINQGDTIKISGTRNAGAAARVEEIIFRPVETVQAGAQLRAGLTYYASLRLFDGNGWGNWYTTMFTMSGSAWATSVSNATGWTIETTMQVIPS